MATGPEGLVEQDLRQISRAGSSLINARGSGKGSAVDVFISWSGDYSRAVAVALGEWLPYVINEVEPFVSTRDIYSGARWMSEIAEQLEGTNFGIVCVTRDNQRMPWLNFEAGALAKSVKEARIIPIAIDLEVSEISLPLGQFQAEPLSKEGIASVLASMNQEAKRRHSRDRLVRAVDMWWPELEQSLAAAQQDHRGRSQPARRSERDIMSEILGIVRGLARQQRKPLRLAVKNPTDRSMAVATHVRHWLAERNIEAAVAAVSPTQIVIYSSEALDEVAPDLLDSVDPKYSPMSIGGTGDGFEVLDLRDD